MEHLLAGFPFLFGIIAAAIHVVSGPDHLAAVSPLALRVPRRSWIIGLSWGIGHVLGMLLIGAMFFYFRDYIPVDLISDHSEQLVGILLIVIGLWALSRLRTTHKHVHDHSHHDEHGHLFIHRHTHHHEHNHHTTVSQRQTWIAALGIGILHGLAGVSHLISLLPTLAFGSNWEALRYLTGFAIGTIIAMIGFTLLLGWVSRSAAHDHRDKLLMWLNGIAGAAAILVGVFWILSTW